MLVFRSEDGLLAVEIGRSRAKLLRRACGKAGDRETGGVLVGFYADDGECAYVTEVGHPPPDSEAGPTWFNRGIRGLREWLEELWGARRRTYYLGEWHYHPRASPEASGDDRKQMLRISKDRKIRCPEPVLLIVGGDARSSWPSNAYVVRGGRFEQLRRC
jgi:integrative and conjugative element protein (TIGR02256 family)